MIWYCMGCDSENGAGFKLVQGKYFGGFVKENIMIDIYIDLFTNLVNIQDSKEQNKAKGDLNHAKLSYHNQLRFFIYNYSEK